MKFFSTFDDVIRDQLGPYTHIRDTAIDESSFHKKDPFNNSYPRRGGVDPSFVANFPKCHNHDWFAQIRYLKIRESGLPNDEVKWGWFRWAQFQMDHTVIDRAYSELGEATIFINDLVPIEQRCEQIFLEMGFRQETVKVHPYIRQMCLRYASEDIMFRTPLFEIHRFDPLTMYDDYVPIDSGDDEVFQPQIYLEKINCKKRVAPRRENVLQFAGEMQAGFQELMDPNISRSIMESLWNTRYLSHDQIRTKRMLWATAANRTIDPGNNKVSSAVKEPRDQTYRKIVGALRYQYGAWIEDSCGGYANTITDYPSHCLDELQMADMACGYAEELFRSYGGQINKLCDHFKLVFFNGRLVER